MDTMFSFFMASQRFGAHTIPDSPFAWRFAKLSLQLTSRNMSRVELRKRLNRHRLRLFLAGQSTLPL
jgi:hypothetical protein